MPTYTIVDGEDSSLADYLDAIQEVGKDDDFKVISYNDEEEFSADDFKGSKAVMVLGDVPDSYRDEIVEQDIPLLSEQPYEDARHVNMEETVAESVYNRLKEAPEYYRAKKLEKELSSKDSMAIVLHDNPDPDAISSGIGLQELASEYGVETEIFYTGNINHQENKAHVNELDLGLTSVEYSLEEEGYRTASGPFTLDQFDGIALLDSSYSNTHLLGDDGEEIAVDIAIDHHDGWEEYKDLVEGFIDIRPERGATASIISEYFRLLDIEPSTKASTSMAHGIMSDTLNLDPSSHKFEKEDVENLAYLYNNVDTSSLAEIMNSSVSASTADTLVKAIQNRKERSTIVTSWVGSVEDTDAIPQAADYLRQLEGISTSIVYGYKEDNIRLSARNSNIKLNIGEELEDIFENTEKMDRYKTGGGGTDKKGGANIPLDAFGIISGVKDDIDAEDLDNIIKHTLEPYLDRIGKD